VDYELGICGFLSRMMKYINTVMQKIKLHEAKLWESTTPSELELNEGEIYLLVKWCTAKFQLIGVEYLNELVSGERDDPDVPIMKKVAQSVQGSEMQEKLKKELKQCRDMVQEVTMDLVASDRLSGKVMKWSNLRSVSAWEDAEFRLYLSVGLRKLFEVFQRCGGTLQNDSAFILSVRFLEVFHHALTNLSWRDVFPPQKGVYGYDFTILVKAEQAAAADLRASIDRILPRISHSGVLRY
jgi:hypothetical protein